MSAIAPAATDNPVERSSLSALTLGALGVVYGDIGTSPLYAFKEAFNGPHALAVDAVNVYGVLSLLFWALMIIVSLKYVVIVLRFDNHGEGGVLALLAFAQGAARSPRMRLAVPLVALFAAALFYGDAVITPAISVLSAVEGLSVATPTFETWIVPIAIGIIVALFAIQRHGTGAMGKLFGPVTVMWFLALAALGIASIVQTPGILGALNPAYAAALIAQSPGLAFTVLGAVFLAVTGAEALYADMGHFGARPIRLAWFGLVLPALVINYFGQGALVLRDPNAVQNPFYLLAPEPLLLPMVALATAATVIASQATISGAFSITQQASRLGYLPRIRVLHTSAAERGQIYIPRVNWIMLAVVVALVAGFGSSTNLAAAYGIAVSGTMLFTTFLIGVVVAAKGGRMRVPMLSLLVVIGAIELVFVASNSTKILAGGWFPLVLGIALFVVLTTWKTGVSILRADEARLRMPLKGSPVLSADVPRVPGTAIYLTADTGAVPGSLLHVLKHFRVLHERMLFITIENVEVPRLRDDDRTEVQVLQPGAVYSATVRYGFLETPDLPRALGLLARHGLHFEMSSTSFFLGKTTLAPASRAGAFTWRRRLFAAMQRNAPSAAEYFGLPANRVVELGTRVTL